MALDLLEQSLPAVGSESDEGRKIMSALSSLSSVLGSRKQKTESLQPAEIQALLQALPQAGGGSPVFRAMMSSPPNLGAMSAPPPVPSPPGSAGGAPGASPIPPQSAPGAPAL